MKALPASRGRCRLVRVLDGTRRASQSPDGSASRTRFGRVAALGVSLLPGPASRLPGSRSPTRPRGLRRGAAVRRPPRSSTARAAAPPTASRRPRRLSSTQIRSALRRGGRQRSIERRAAEVRDVLRSPQLEAPAAVSKAFAASTRAAVGQISEINRCIEELEAALEASFEPAPGRRDLPLHARARRRPRHPRARRVRGWRRVLRLSVVPSGLRRYFAADGSIPAASGTSRRVSSATGGSTTPPTNGHCARCGRARLRGSRQHACARLAHPRARALSAPEPR